MTVDKTTKILLFLIALGLFLNALNPWLLPRVAYAQHDELSGIATTVKSIDKRLANLMRGTPDCLNSKICP